MRQITATDLIFMAAEQRGKPITSEDLKNSDIMHDLKREEKLLDQGPPKHFQNCSGNCAEEGHYSCQCP